MHQFIAFWSRPRPVDPQKDRAASSSDLGLEATPAFDDQVDRAGTQPGLVDPILRLHGRGGAAGVAPLGTEALPASPLGHK